MAADDVGGLVVTLEAESAVQSKCVRMEAGKEKKKPLTFEHHTNDLVYNDLVYSLILVYRQIKNYINA